MPRNVLTVTGRRTPLLLNIEKKVRPSSERPRLAVDAMGSDAGPAEVVAGVAKALANGLCADVSFFGDGDMVGQIVNGHAQLASATVVHADSVVQMTDKPMHVLRRGRDTSMWAAVTAVSQGAADAVLSGGNTGALMAVARRQIGMIKGVERPAITALWPSPKGRVVVLDVGANVDASDRQLVSFAIMGEAFFRALTGKLKPSVGLLNVGAEELKGHDTVRSAAALLRRADAEMAFQGFVEGNDISEGVVDVVVTDGFTGNVALKSAEGAARLVGGWMKEALTGSLISKLSAALMGRELKSLRQKIDPSSVNGGVFLGINGIVVKSHGGANASGVASAASMAAALTGRGFRRDVADNVGRVFATLDAASTGQDANTDQQSSGIKAVV
ncbi:MAG: phosphate acyltransferase PlsX [Parvularculaceae bacterium]|nr:MAG: phosphate acyltransferase PlsX [Parvularculaceae bacterium]